MSAWPTKGECRARKEASPCAYSHSVRLERNMYIDIAIALALDAKGLFSDGELVPLALFKNRAPDAAAHGN